MIRFLLACMCVLATNSAFAADAPLTLVKTIPRKGVDGKLDHIAVDPKGERLYVANKPNNTLDIVDLKNRQAREADRRSRKGLRCRVRHRPRHGLRRERCGDLQ